MPNMLTRDIKILSRRALYLKSRISENSDRDLSYDKAEYQALMRAVACLEEQDAKNYKLQYKDAGWDYSPDNWVSHQSNLGD